MKKKVFKIAGIAIIVIILAGLTFNYINTQKFLHQFDHLIEPKVSTKAQQNMLVAYMEGDPDKDSGNAIGNLYKYIYKYKDLKQPPVLRGRWQFDANDTFLRGKYFILVRMPAKIRLSIN